MKARNIFLAGLAAGFLTLALWPEPGIYLGHSTETVRAHVPGVGETDHPILRCRYFSLGGIERDWKWPAETVPGTSLVPNNELAATDGQDCWVRWPFDGKGEV